MSDFYPYMIEDAETLQSALVDPLNEEARMGICCLCEYMVSVCWRGMGSHIMLHRLLFSLLRIDVHHVSCEVDQVEALVNLL